MTKFTMNNNSPFMAKINAPFKIIGTIDDLNFYVDQNNENIVRIKGRTGVTSEEFNRNPIFTKVKNHGKEFGRAVKKASNFRMLAQPFNLRAKDGSFAGRANKLLLEIIQEDTTNSHGERTFEEGMKNPEVKNFFLGFEGNKIRPLNLVLKTEWTWDENSNSFVLENFQPEKHLDWPESANQAHIAIAVANWNYIENSYKTEFSEEYTLAKEDKPSKVKLEINTLDHPKPSSPENSRKMRPNITQSTPEMNLSMDRKVEEQNLLQLTYLFIGFSVKERNKTKELKKDCNTVSIIWSK
jgi:hypothetical protein